MADRLLLYVQVEKELRDICTDMLDVLDKHLIPAASTGESKVFYFKMYVCVIHAYLIVCLYRYIISSANKAEVMCLFCLCIIV